jgi:hypothetical protein
MTTRLPRNFPRLTALLILFAVAPSAVELTADPLFAFVRFQDPGPRFQRRTMSYVSLVAARQKDTPMALFVLIK